MKIIVDIDENYYKGICKIVERFGKGSVVLSTPEKIIFNGTPLEEELVAELLDLRSEIEIYEAQIYDNPYCSGLKKTMEFIDNRIAKMKRKVQWINGKN